MEELKVKLLNKDAKAPVRAHKRDSGIDLYATENMRIESHSSVLVPTGVAIQLEDGYEATVRPKSGISAKTAKRVVLGTVDTDYRGEIKVVVDNVSDNQQIIEKGKKIAQLVISPVLYPSVKIVEDFEEESDRGKNGFGSTGLD